MVQPRAGEHMKWRKTRPNTRQPAFLQGGFNNVIKDMHCQRLVDS